MNDLDKSIAHWSLVCYRATTVDCESENEGVVMTLSDYKRFIADCIAVDAGEDCGLTDDELYGVYISWCAMQGHSIDPCKAFWAAMTDLGFHRRRRVNRRYVRPGLRMKGPAAVDYIIASQVSLV